MSTPLSRLAALPTANIGDATDRLSLADGALRAVWPGARLAGPAFTVWTRAGDNLWIHKAVDAAPAGSVIVVNGGGDPSRALIGELLGARALAKGILGFAIDGAVRDAGGLQEVGMPVFARSVTPAGPYKDGPGRLQVPIAFGGISVAPGDLVLGDADGIAIVAASEAAAIADAAEAVEANEHERMAAYLRAIEERATEAA